MRARFNEGMPPPPIHHLLGLEPVSASPAAVTFSMPCSPWLQTDAAVFFAGTAALVADAPLGGAVMAGLGPGQIAVTSDLSFNFFRPIDTHGEHLIARARPIEVGRTLGVAEAVIEDGRGHLVAHGTTRCFVIDVDVPAAGEVPPVDVRDYETPDPYLRPIQEDAVQPERWDRMTFTEIFELHSREDEPNPPFVDLFHFRKMEVQPGRFTSYFPASRWFTSPAGTIYGGVIAYAADSALSGAFGSTLEKNEIAATLDLKVHFLRPVMPDDRELKVSARVMHRGRSLATAQAEITNEDGKPVAFAMSSAAIRTGRSWSSFVVADEAVTPEAPTV
jgi:uncharacterized protein (TIGR00369 family)